MKVLSNQLKPLFIEAAAAAFPELAEGDLVDTVAVEEPRDPSHGDYACTAPFKLAKKLGKKPAEIGEALVENFPKDYRVGSVEFMGPGFVNLRLSATFLEEELKVLEQGFSVEGEDRRKKPVIVEYSCTNAAKHMGVHHLITTILGDVLANLHEFMGYEVIRINHLGDWGTNFGKLIYGVEEWGNKKKIRENPNDELTKLYVHFNNKAEKHPELNDEARKIFKSLEEGDPKRINMWKWIVSESVADLEKTFRRLGVQFDHIMGESFYLEMADEIIEDGVKRGLFVEGEGGALIFDMGEDQVPALLRKSDGTTLYLTRDVATARYRVETWHPEKILYVVDHAQSLHFQQDFAIVNALGYAEGTELEHVAFGRMNFSDMAMSTRKGNVIKITKLLSEARNRAVEMAKKHGNEMEEEELMEEAEMLGIASVKYGILAQDRVKDIVFAWDKIITLEGNSAPYLLYSYARANSIVGKVGDVKLSGMPKLTEEAEIALVRMLLKFPDELENALAERKPHIICAFLYELCHEFNRFYGAIPVLKAESEEARRSRVGIVHGFMHVLKSGLSILGIPVLERM